LSPLANAIYELLRQRTGQPEPRVTYAELARQLRDLSGEFAHVHHRNPQLYAALCEVGDECRRLRLPSLPALVVRADTGRPGAAYHKGSKHAFKGERIAEWREEVAAVKAARYPAR
jgi:hypothetical protein